MVNRQLQWLYLQIKFRVVKKGKKSRETTNGTLKERKQQQ